MAWVAVGSNAALYEGSTLRAYASFQYDNSSGTTSRNCRLVIIPSGQNTFYVSFQNITINGSNKGTVTNVTQNYTGADSSHPAIWSGSVAAGSVTVTWTNPWYAGTKNCTITGTVPTGAVAPAAPTVTLDSFTDTTVTLSMAVSDYGTPAAASGRKLRGAVLGLNSWTDPCRYQDVTNVNSATVTLSNASGTGATPLTLAGNTQYYYGAEANNTALSTHTIASNAFITLPAYITNVTVADDGHNDMTISVLHDSEGSADTVYTEYSYDQQTWTAVPETFHLTVYSATTVYLRRENGAGVTPVYTVSIVPVTTIKLYGSVNGQAKTIRKLYGSVNGQSKRIRKLYGSVNGRSKLIFEDNS